MKKRCKIPVLWDLIHTKQYMRNAVIPDKGIAVFFYSTYYRVLLHFLITDKPRCTVGCRSPPNSI